MQKESSFENLRERAEKFVPAGAVEEMSPAESSKLLHELQIHQRELEMQNDELQTTYMDLAKSRDRFSFLFHQAPVGYVVLDEAGIIHESNTTFEKMLSCRPGDLQHRPLADFICEEDIRFFLGTFRSWMDSKVNKTLKLSLKKKDGGSFEARLEGKRDSAISDQDSPRYLLTIADITEACEAERRLSKALEDQNELEKRVLRAQKLESIGILAGGVAHDFNNILQVMLGNAQLALKLLGEAHPASRFLIPIVESSRHAAKICGQMLSYAGFAQNAKKPFDLALLLSQTETLIRASIPKNVDLDFSHCNDNFMVEGDESLIKQAIMNLVLNASESCGTDSGKVSVSISRFDPHDCNAEAWVGDPPDSSTSYAMIIVSDTGCGISKENLSRIFEPFFTTKFTGRGLGLSALQGIVRSHSGALAVESEEGKGSSFVILLPLIDAGLLA